MSKLKVIVSGGGTGGHIFPAIAIANAIKELEPDADILFVGALGRMEMEKVPAAGYPIEGLPIDGLHRDRLLSLDTLKLPFKILKSQLMARQIIQKFKPDIAVGVGGYASYPLLKAAGAMGIPYVIQEQNSFAGKTNKALGKKARVICVAYPGMERFFPKERILMTGNPIRSNLTPPTSERKAEALDFFGLGRERRTVLIIGGSLGAYSINKVVAAYMDKVDQGRLQLIWQCGKKNATQEMISLAAQHPENVKMHAFINRMDLAYAAADVVISRAGASSISELCVVAKPCIFVPSPNVAEDHQTHNAMALVKQEAALMVPDAEAMTRLMPLAESLATDEPRCAHLTRHIARLALPEAATDIARIVLKTACNE